MSAKITESRKSAFLKALSETGNVTISAERAKVSRSWVLKQRRADVGFEAEFLKAKRQSFDRLRMSGERKPPKGWGFLDGEELVVKGSGSGPRGGRVQIARARIRQITPRVEERFLDALSRTCNIKASARWAGISYGALYSHRKRWPDFERRWLEALKRGHEELDQAVLSTAISFMSGEGIPEGSPFSSMTVMDAIRYLNMQKYSVYGSGRPPGVQRR